MGYKNSPFWLQQSLNKALQSLKNIIVLADDIVCVSEIGIIDNIQTVVKVIEKLNEAGYKLNPKKLKLARTSLETLGVQYHMGT